MKSTLVNMVAVLFTITLVASAGVGYVNMITVGPIAEAKAAATQSALRAVLPSFDRTETTELTLDELPVAVHTARSGEAVVGYAVETASKNGFSGMIRMVVGFDATGRVLQCQRVGTERDAGPGNEDGRRGQPALRQFRGPQSGRDEARREEGRRRRGCADGRHDFVASLRRRHGARLCRLQADCGRGCSGRFRYGFGGYGDGRRCCGRGRFGCGCDRTNGR